MALLIETNISCDGCGALFRTTTSPINGGAIRKLTCAAGWSRSKNRDICPACVAGNNINPRTNKKYPAKLIFKKVSDKLKHNGKDVHVDEFELDWPGNEYDKETVYRRRVYDLTPAGYMRTRYMYTLGKDGKPFNSIKKFLDYHDL